MTYFYIKDQISGERIERLDDITAVADRVEEEFDISFERWLVENNIDTNDEEFDAEFEYLQYRDLLITDILCNDMFEDFIDIVEEE